MNEAQRLCDWFRIEDRTEERVEPSFWPWVTWRRYRRARAAMAVRHAKERAAFEVWRIEVERLLADDEAG